MFVWNTICPSQDTYQGDCYRKSLPILAFRKPEGLLGQGLQQLQDCIRTARRPEFRFPGFFLPAGNSQVSCQDEWGPAVLSSLLLALSIYKLCATDCAMVSASSQTSLTLRKLSLFLMNSKAVQRQHFGWDHDAFCLMNDLAHGAICACENATNQPFMRQIESPTQSRLCRARQKPLSCYLIPTAIDLLQDNTKHL